MLTSRLKKWMTISAAALFWTATLCSASVSCACSLLVETGCPENSCCCSPESVTRTTEDHSDCLRCITGALPFENAQQQAVNAPYPVTHLPAPILNIHVVPGTAEIPLPIPDSANQAAGLCLSIADDSTVILRI